MLAFGADKLRRRRLSTELVTAANRDDYETALAILDSIPECDSNANEREACGKILGVKATGGGTSPLLAASLLGHPRVVTLLLERGANPEEAGNGLTPLHLAAMHCRREAAIALLEHGAKIGRVARGSGAADIQRQLGPQVARSE